MLSQGDNSPGQKNKCHMFVSFVDAGFESSDMCVSFGIPREVRDLLRPMGRDFMGEEGIDHSCIKSQKGKTEQEGLNWSGVRVG